MTDDIARPPPSRQASEATEAPAQQSRPGSTPPDTSELGAPQHSPSPTPWWRRLFRRDPRRAAREQASHSLYVELVKAARQPYWYLDLEVPDTPEGRFEMVALHVALTVRRLRAEGEAGRELAQSLFDLMVKDMDRSLRDIGIGDLSVGKYVKRLVGNFYARLQALDQALDGGDAMALVPALRSNVYRGVEPGDAAVEALARDLAALARVLAAEPGTGLLTGTLVLEPPQSLRR